MKLETIYIKCSSTLLLMRDFHRTLACDEFYAFHLTSHKQNKSNLNYVLVPNTSIFNIFQNLTFVLESELRISDYQDLSSLSNTLVLTKIGIQLTCILQWYA